MLENKEVKTDAKEGEWIVEGRFIYILHNPDGRYPRNKFHAQVCPDWFGKVPEAEAEKVAQVFGAAYDMLEALKLAKEELTFLYAQNRNTEFWSETSEQNFSKINAAIQKAQPHE